MIVGGLQIELNKDWVLKRPNLVPLSPEGVINYPIRPNENQTQKYTGPFLIPIVYPHTPNQESLSFGVAEKEKRVMKKKRSFFTGLQ